MDDKAGIVASTNDSLSSCCTRALRSSLTLTHDVTSPPTKSVGSKLQGIKHKIPA